MRAQNQQDLIYKRGQAGVTKASVTIVFDNSDREKSPVGFENLKQITVTRQVRSQPATHLCLNLTSYTDSTSKHIKIPSEWSQIAAEQYSDIVPECTAEY
jgi:chromosome segregation ATPase